MTVPGGEGDEAGGAADDGFAGDGAVLVVVAQVGVELVRQPVPGVVREQPQHHLQAAPPEALQVLARGREDRPTAEPGGRPAADAARRAHELLPAAQPGQEMRNPWVTEPPGMPVRASMRSTT